MITARWRLIPKRFLSTRASLINKSPAPSWSIASNRLPTENELAILEENVIKRKHNNNVPLIKELITKLAEKSPNESLQKKLQEELRKLPNQSHPQILSYGDIPYELTRFGAEPPKGKGFKEFADICNDFNLFRMNHLGNWTGHKSYYLMGALAELEQALIAFSIDTLKQHGFELISVPDILPNDVIEGCGMCTEGERNQVYKIDSGLCLSGTAEMALAGYFANNVFEQNKLPIQVAAVSRCYRAETSGLHEEKGIYRVHQFTKVEMFSVCSDEQSDDILDKFKEIEMSIFKQLGLYCRMLDMPPNELGAPAYRKYDIEAWMPGRKMWGELSSCSNCTDYQAKRLNIQYMTPNDQLKFAHTVNGTAVAIPRLLIALIENNQREHGSITLPPVLANYMQNTQIQKDKRIPELKLLKNFKHNQ